MRRWRKSTRSAAVLIDPAIGAAGDVDTATVSAKMSNGALALIDNSRKAVYGYDQRAEVFGSKGSVQNGNDLPSTMVLSTVDGVTAEKPLWFFLQRYITSYAAEVRSFIDCIEQDSEPEVGNCGRAHDHPHRAGLQEIARRAPPGAHRRNQVAFRAETVKNYSQEIRKSIPDFLQC